MSSNHHHPQSYLIAYCQTGHKLGCANAIFPPFFLRSRASIITSAGYSRTNSWPQWAQHLFEEIVFFLSSYQVHYKLIIRMYLLLMSRNWPMGGRYSTDFTKWDRFFISGWPALTLASPSLARAQARRDRRRIGCAQRMKWARAPTRFGPGKYTRPNPTWACTQYTVWRLTWML